MTKGKVSLASCRQVKKTPIPLNMGIGGINFTFDAKGLYHL